MPGRETDVDGILVAIGIVLQTVFELMPVDAPWTWLGKFSTKEMPVARLQCFKEFARC